jgi:hypothetical protein
MNPKQAKLAYSLFFSCFAVWLILIPSISFLSDGDTTSAILPSQFILALFIVSAVLSAIPAMLIGLHFLGIDVRIRKYKLRPIPTSPKDYIKETEEDHSKYESICKDWSLTEQTAVTEHAAVGLEGNLKGKVRSKEEKKAFFLFGETEFNGCTFKLGYLKSLPKNKPIPDECFGCPQILECIALSENK